MNTLIQTEVFQKWLMALRDAKAKFRILARLRLAELGNFGDCKPVGEGVSEMRVDVGAGYRIYVVKKRECVYIILAGGDKSSQNRDIAAAKSMAREWRKKDELYQI